MRLLARLAVLLAVLVCAAPTAAGSDTTIRPGRSIGGAALGDSPARVRARIGAGRVLARGRNDFGRYVRIGYPGRGLIVTYLEGSATLLEARFARYRTVRGIGVRSALAALRQEHSTVRREYPGVWLLGRLQPGARVTVFRVRAGRVVTVAVGLVLD